MWTVWPGVLVIAGIAWAAPFEAWQGVELGGSRMLGMGGAYLAVAEGAQAGLDNPAALAVRDPRAADQWRSSGVTIGTAGLNTLSGFAPDDVNAEAPERRLRLGGVVRRGPVAVGAYASTIGYAFDRRPETPTFSRLEHGSLAVGAGYAIGGGELVVGVLGQLWFAGLTTGDTGLFGREIEDVAVGPGATVGALWAPALSRWRVGLRARSPATTLPGDDDPPLLEVRWPVEVGLGVAWQAGVPRNLPATYGVGPAPEREGRYLLLASDVDVLGPTDGAAIPTITGDSRRAGSGTTVAVHVGAEAEVLPHRIIVRTGAYTEPGRQPGVPNRLHGTAGAAFFVGRFPVIEGLRISPAVDLARDWFRLSIGVGPW